VSFDAIAPWYRALEWLAFGEQLQRCRIACLAEIAAPRRALIVGEGNGRFLYELLRAHPTVEVDCVDASGRMLQLARQRLEQTWPDRAAHVHFLNDDITSWNVPEDCYDLIVTHFVFDCFREPELALIIEKLATAAAEDATWLLADFSIPAAVGLARLRARVWLTVMYQFFRFTARIPAIELIDPTPFILDKEFVLVRRHLFQNGMLRSEIWRNIGILPVRPADMMSAASDSAE
jgi:ubiquinone/menaquinone biosynthesis C-methylase UbiE